MKLQAYACGLLIFGNRVFRCALGQGGVRSDKIEGDGATPAGHFPLREVLYRSDRGQIPDTRLGVSSITSNDAWCDDPGAAAYNRRISLPHQARHEKLFRSDNIYDIIVPLGYNDDPPVPNLGSAIFLHLARDDYNPTEGCIAVARPDLLTILGAIKPGDRLNITQT